MKKLSYLLLVFIFCITSCSEENETIAPQQPEQLSLSSTTETTRTSSARVVARGNIRGEVKDTNGSVGSDFRFIYQTNGWAAIDRLYPTPQAFDMLFAAVYLYDISSNPGQEILIGSGSVGVNVISFQELILKDCVEAGDCDFSIEIDMGLASLIPIGSQYRAVTTIYTFGVSEPLMLDEQFLIYNPIP